MVGPYYLIELRSTVLLCVEIGLVFQMRSNCWRLRSVVGAQFQMRFTFFWVGCGWHGSAVVVLFTHFEKMIV